MAGSAFQTPATVRQNLSAKPTPMNGARSVSASRRSKVAGALRGGTDIDGDGDLSDILEDEHEMQRVSTVMRLSHHIESQLSRSALSRTSTSRRKCITRSPRDRLARTLPWVLCRCRRSRRSAITRLLCLPCGTALQYVPAAPGGPFWNQTDM